jgi:uncharacterized membrane protein
MSFTTNIVIFRPKDCLFISYYMRSYSIIYRTIFTSITMDQRTGIVIASVALIIAIAAIVIIISTGDDKNSGADVIEWE